MDPEHPQPADRVAVSRYYDRHGNPITLEQWAQLFKNDEYKRVYGTVIDTPGGQILVSTVWLGLDHSFWPDLPPLIFETMVFDEHGNAVLQDRYTTEGEAKAGHWQVVTFTRSVREVFPTTAPDGAPHPPGVD